MSYFIINGIPVFLTLSKEKDLRYKVLQDKSPEYRVSSIIKGTDANKAAKHLMHQYLIGKYNENPAVFKSEWAQVDFCGDEAQEAVWDLLYAYCCLYERARLVDLRNDTDKQLRDWEGMAYAFPMGYIFALDYIVQPRKWWQTFTTNTKDNTVRFVIDCQDIICINGELSHFKIRSRKYTLECGKQVTIR